MPTMPLLSATFLAIAPTLGLAQGVIAAPEPPRALEWHAAIPAQGNAALRAIQREQHARAKEVPNLLTPAPMWSRAPLSPTADPTPRI